SGSAPMTAISSPNTCSATRTTWRRRARGRARAPPEAPARPPATSTPPPAAAPPAPGGGGGGGDPLVIAPGNGLERGRNGGAAIRVAIALPALMGKLNGKSGIVLGARNAFPKTPARLTRPDLIPPGTRTLNILDVGRHLERDDLDPPLRAVFIYNHNPIVVHPDQARMQRALKREDIFFVGIEVAMTESMRHCDVVLPAATHFECDDLYAAYGHHWLQRAEAVIPPVGEALPNTEIFRRLAARFGFDDPCFKATDAELMDDAVDPGDRPPGGGPPG